MKEKRVLGIIGMLLVVSLGFSSASLVPYLSNIVTGTFSINGPIFYVDGGQKLSVNDNQLSGGQYNFKGQDKILLKTAYDYGGIDFYGPELEFVLDLEIDNYTFPRGLELEFGYIQNTGNSVRICNTQYISIVEDGIITVSCPHSISSLSGVKEFYFSFEGMAEDYVNYKVKHATSYVRIIGENTNE